MASSSPSQRQLRAGELIRHAVVEILLRGDINDPALDSADIVVTEVQMSPDLRIANVYIGAVQGDKSLLLQNLIRHQKYLRGLLAKKISMRFIPEIRFKLDSSADYASHIDVILKSPAVVRDLKKDGDKA